METKKIECNAVLVQKIEDGGSLLFRDVPTLDFLYKKHIVPVHQDWAPIDDDFPEHPIDRAIRFTNGISITSQMDKLVIRGNYKNNATCKQVVDVSCKIIDKLKPAEYSGAGINFLSIIESEDPGKEISDRFFAEVKHIPKSIAGGSFTYVYFIDEVQVSITVRGAKKTEDNDKKAIAVQSNYHFPSEYPKKIKQFIEKAQQFEADYGQQIAFLFG